MKRALPALLAIPLAACQAPTAPAPPAVDPWEPAVAVGDAGEFGVSEVRRVDSSLAVAPDGRALAVWVRRTAGGSQAWAAWRTASGWAPALCLQDDDALPRVSRVRVGLDARGEGWAAWNERGPGEARVVVRRASQGAWAGPPQVLDVVYGRSDDLPLALAVDATGEGDALLAWIARERVLAAAATGSRWGTLDEIAEPEPDFKLVDVAAAQRGSMGALVWLDVGHSKRSGSASHAVLRDRERGWIGRRGLSGGSIGQTLPRPLVDSHGDVTVVSSGGSNTDALFASRWREGTWSDVVLPVVQGGAPLAVDGAGNVLAGLSMYPGVGVELGWLPAGDLRLENVVRVNTTASNAHDVAVAMDAAGRAAAVFTEQTGPRVALGGRPTWEVTAIPGSRPPGRAHGCTTTSPHEPSPQVAVDASGTAIVTWVQWECTSGTVWSRRRGIP